MEQHLPEEGLYDPRFEHDACGVAFVADLKRGPSHEIVDLGLTALENLAHRGAFGADPETGDGAGILIQLPDAFFRAVVDFPLPKRGHYVTGLAFLPVEEKAAAASRAEIATIAGEEGLLVAGWRVVPVDLAQAGKAAMQVAPRFEQLFLVPDPSGPVAGATDIALDRAAFIARKRIEHELGDTYFPSLSSRTFIYKGMLSTEQLRLFFSDLSDERVESALALVHSRFSTNTFHSWPLAHPYRLIAHNGEINTVQGNKNWMRSREALLESTLLHGDLRRITPVVTARGSDSASFDEVVELLHLGGRSLPHAILMMIPEAWENHAEMDAPRKAFYQYHGCLMEPWDGPAAVAFTDGEVIGAVLDRNGLRPARYWVRDDGLVVLASEVGVLEMEPARIVKRVVCSRVACSCATSPLVASSTTTRSSPNWPPTSPTPNGSPTT
jgi:glutamate synthase (NADPH/NADH) large chain